jgi:hypothetical protein
MRHLVLLTLVLCCGAADAPPWELVTLKNGERVLAQVISDTGLRLPDGSTLATLGIVRREPAPRKALVALERAAELDRDAEALKRVVAAWAKARRDGDGSAWLIAHAADLRKQAKEIREAALAGK